MKLHPYDLECIHLAKDILIKNFLESKTINFLAREVGINESKLKRGFKQLYNLPIHTFLIQQRLEKARMMLEETDKPVKEIALACGYKRLSSLTKSFKKTFKQSPVSWRKDNSAYALSHAI